MILTLVAEILAGETVLTPGGCIDAVTAGGDEPRLWGEREPVLEATAAEAGVEVVGSAAAEPVRR